MLFKKSKRERLVYIVMIVWVVFGFLGFFYSVDFSKLTAYFGVFSTNVMAYLWAETSRPHNT
jgi:hypothetical protein